MTPLDTKDVQNNAKVIHTLYYALDVNEFNRIFVCEIAKKNWDKLKVTHKGTSQVKEWNISMLVHKYELFRMEVNETISKIFSRFTNIINGLKSLKKYILAWKWWEKFLDVYKEVRDQKYILTWRLVVPN